MQIDIDDREILDRLKKYADLGRDPEPVLRQIGEHLVDSTKQRFRTGKGPDGTPWPQNTETTLAGILTKYKGSRTKTGRLSAAGRRRKSNKKPLIGETRSLSTTINYQINGGRLAVGSPMEYAAVQQFGAQRGEFGNNALGLPIPWGTIPPRPFLGLSPADRNEIGQIFADHLRRLR